MNISKSFLLAFITLILGVAPLRAQLVADGATTAINATSTNITGGLIVGNSGSFTTLIVTNGGAVTNTTTGIIGFGLTARTNRVIVTGNNSVWANGTTLAIGNNGSFNLLLITNGGRVVNTFGNIGVNASGSNNTVVVTGSNSTWFCTQVVNVGSVGSFSRLWITNGGRVETLSGAIPNGSTSGSIGNLAVVAGNGSFWNNANTLSVGMASTLNQLWITNGGRVLSDAGYIGANAAQTGTGSTNAVTLSGPGASWTNNGIFVIGNSGISNQLTISQGAVMRNTASGGDLRLGARTEGGRNTMLVTGTNTLFSNRGTTSTTSIGYVSSLNQILIRDGATVESDIAYVGASGGSNNLALVADPGSKWFASSVLGIGLGGYAGQLIVTNGGVVENRNLGYVGGNPGSSNNLAVVTGAGSLWTNGAALYIGNSGASNRLIIANGGTVTATNFVVGFDAASSNNLVSLEGGNLIVTNAAGKLITDVRRGTLQFSGGNLDTDFLFATNGSAGAAFNFNHGNLTTRAGSALVQSNHFLIGSTLNETAAWTMLGGTNTITLGNLQNTRLGTLGGRRGVVTVAGASTVWSNSGALHIGYGSSSNQLFIRNGGWVTSSSGYVGTSVSTSGNEVLITDSGSRWTCGNDLNLGNFGMNNRLVVSNGGWMVNDTAFVGSGNDYPSNNVIVVTGTGSRWDNQTALYLGWGSASNSVVVASNALLTAPLVTVGVFVQSSNNVLTVSGGTVVVTNSAGDARLRIAEAGQGALVFNNGLVQTDRLLVTNGTKSIFTFNGGTLQTAGTLINNGSPCVVGNGSSAAVLELIGNGSHLFANDLLINANAELRGKGAVTGNVSIAGILAPGASIGQLVVTGFFACLAGSTNWFELNRAAGTNDHLVVSGNLSYGGTLVVTNLAGTLTNGDSFKLFTAPVYQGTFSSLVLPALGPGLMWKNKLTVDGSLEVINTPVRDFGVDVSHFQGEGGISATSWAQMYTAGKRFVFVKATEGLSVLDAAMPNNMTRATEAGLRAGVYHFAHPELRPTTGGAVQEADYLLSYAGNFIGPGYLRPVLDLETGSGLTTTELTDWVLAFVNQIVTHRGPGAAPILYTFQSYANNELDSRLANYDLWLRTITAGDVTTNDPPSQGFADPTGVFNDWSFWQYSASGSSGGISPLDLNVCHSEFKALDSFLIPAVTNPVAPLITVDPQDRTVNVGNSATFSVTVSVSSSTPLSYQWRFYETNLAGATGMAYTRTNAQLADAGPYTVVITNAGGSVTSAIATLTVTNPPPSAPPIVLYEENFDGYASPSVVTAPGTTNGFKIFYGATGGPIDFTARFGFDYSTVTSPTNIPSAPHSSGGTTKGLYLTVNKDGTSAAAAVNLYPVSQVFTGNFALKFDLWINYPNTGTATEHALFGINHSGNITNRVGQTTSDGLFFAVDGDGAVSSGSATLRDFAIFRGGGSGAIPLLLTSGFGPEPLLGLNFDNADAGFAGLFPPKTLPTFTTIAGTPGNGWVSVEVRQEGNLITWLLNHTLVAQYTNTPAYTNGNILIGYNDHFPTAGGADNFVIFDNLRVEAPGSLPAPIQLTGINAALNGSFQFSFTNTPGALFTVLGTTNAALPLSNWSVLGPVSEISPGQFQFTDLAATNHPRRYYRVRWP